MIKLIELNDALKENFEIPDTMNYLTGLDKINVFVGINNSGKSRFLRSLMVHVKNCQLIIEGAEIQEFNYERLWQNTLKWFGEARLTYAGNSFSFLKEEELNEQIEKLKAINCSELDVLFKIAGKLNNVDHKDFLIAAQPAERSQAKIAVDSVNRIASYITSSFSKELKQNLTRLYIPILRGLRPLGSKNVEDVYDKRTQEDYFKTLETRQSLNLFTGQKIYSDVDELYAGNEEDRDKLKEFEKFISDRIFLQPVILIPKRGSDVLEIKIDKDRQRPIYEVGDGIQTVLTLLFPIFKRKDEELLVFIEEPELHLHPEWQNFLIKVFRENFPLHQFFITTHSSHFINAQNAAIYSFEKVGEKTRISLARVKNEKAALLAELGYKPSDLFQTNYILWVEGPSDKIYLNYFIKEIAPELEEGQHYSILFFSGSNFEHYLEDEKEYPLEFLSTISQNMGIILDSDKKSKRDKLHAKKERLKQIFEKGAKFCWITGKREIENYIPVEIFEEVVKEVHKKKAIQIHGGDYEDRSEVIEITQASSLKSTIKLSEGIFSKVQKNKNGSTKGINDSDLRTEIERAIKATLSNSFKINKIRVAEEIVNRDDEILNSQKELKMKMEKLVGEIKAANKIQF